MKRTKDVRRQRPIEGGRDAIYGGLPPGLKKEIDRQCNHLIVSRPLFITTAIADAIGYDLEKEDRAADRQSMLMKKRRMAKIIPVNFRLRNLR